MGLFSYITSALTNKHEVKQKVKENLLSEKTSPIIGFSLLSEEDREKYADHIADQMVGREFRLLGTTGWLLSAPTTAQVVNEAEEKINLIAANKLLNRIPIEHPEGSGMLVDNISYETKQEYLLELATWFKSHKSEVLNTDSINIREGDIGDFLTRSQHDYLTKRREYLATSLEGFDVAIDIFEKVVKGELNDGDDVKDDMEYLNNLLGNHGDDEFEVAHSKVIEKLNRVFDEPKYRELSDAVVGGNLSFSTILSNINDSLKDEIDAKVSDILVGAYLSTPEDTEIIVKDLEKVVEEYYSALLDSALQINQKNEVLAKVKVIYENEGVYVLPERESRIIQAYKDLYLEPLDFARDFDLLDETDADSVFVDYSISVCDDNEFGADYNSDTLHLEDKIKKLIDHKKVEIVKESLASADVGVFNSFEQLELFVSEDKALLRVVGEFLEYVKTELYHEGVEECTGFSLLSDEEKKECIVRYLSNAIDPFVDVDPIEYINNKIHLKVKGIVRRHEFDILGTKITSYDSLGDDDEFDTHSFKTYTRNGFLEYYKEAKGSGTSTSQIIDDYLNKPNKHIDDLDRTASRFYLYHLADNISDNLYDAFIRALLKSGGGTDPIMPGFEEPQLFSRYTEILEGHIDVPMSKYLRVAMNSGATIEQLFKRDGESYADSRKEINELLKVGCSAIDIASGSEVTTLNSTLDLILLKARDNATRFLEAKAEQEVSNALGDNIHWLDQESLNIARQSYVEQVLSQGRDVGKWQLSISNVAKIAKAKQLKVLDELKDEMELYNIDTRRKSALIKMGEKEVLDKLKSGDEPNVNRTLEYLSKKYSLKRIRHIDAEGRLDAVEVGDLSRFSELLAEKEQVFRKLGVEGDDNVRLDKAHVAMSAAKRAVEKKALGHYFDVMFETVVGMEKLVKLDYLTDKEQVHIEMLKELNIPLDTLDEAKRSIEVYNTLKAQFIAHRANNLDITDSDNRLQVSLKSRLYRLKEKQHEDKELLRKAPLFGKGAISKRVSEREKEIAKLYMDLQYENQRALFLRFSRNFDNDVKKPILRDRTANKHIMAFVSAISQSLKSTATFDFSASAANIAYNMSDSWEARDVSFLEAVVLGKVHDLADSLIGDEVEKEVSKLFKKTSKDADRQLKYNARVLSELDGNSLQPDDKEEQYYSFDSDTKTAAVFEGLLGMMKNVVFKDELPRESLAKYALFKTSSTMVQHAAESGGILYDAFKILDKKQFDDKTKGELIEIEIELRSYLDSLTIISRDMSLEDVKKANNNNLKISGKLIALDKQLSKIARESNNATLIGLSTTYSAVTSGISKSNDVLTKIKDIILDKAELVDNEASKAGIKQSSVIHTMLLSLQSTLVEQGAGVALAKDKNMLKKYVTGIIHDSNASGFTPYHSGEHSSDSYTIEDVPPTHGVDSDAGGSTSEGNDVESTKKHAQSDISDDESEFSFGGARDEEAEEFEELVRQAQKQVDSEIRNSTPFNEDANSNKFLRGMFKFINRVVYFFKHGKLPPSNMLISQRVREVNNMFQAKFHEEKAKSKLNVLINVSRLMSTLGSCSGKCSEYGNSISDNLTDRSKLYVNYLCDDEQKLSLSMFPEIDLQSLKSTYFKGRKKDYVGYQQALENKMKEFDLQRYESYMKEIKEKTPSVVFGSKDKLTKIQNEEFLTRKRHYESFDGDVDSMQPKEVRALMRQYNLVCQEQKSLIDLQKEKRKIPWFKFISFFKEDRYTSGIRDLQKQKEFLLSKMVSTEMEISFNNSKQEFNKEIVKEIPQTFDPLVLKDQKATALVAVKHMFEKADHVRVKHIGLETADEFVNRQGKVKVKGLVSDIVNTAVNIPSDKTFRKLVSKGAEKLTFSEYKDELSYISSLAKNFEENPPQVVKLEGADSTWQQSRDEYTKWLKSADKTGDVVRELERLGEIKPQRSFVEQIFIDSISAVASKAQSVVKLKTMVTRYSDAFAKKVEQDPSALDSNSVDTFFGAVLDTFVDQKVLNLKASLEIIKDKEDNEWVQSNKDVFSRMESILNELKELDMIKRQLADKWKTTSHIMTPEEKQEIFEQLNKVRQLRLDYGNEISKELDVLCKSSPDTKDQKIIEGFCHIRWSESYIDFYGDIIDKVHQSADELLHQRDIIKQDRLEDRGTEGVIQKRLIGMVATLGDTLGDKLNAAPIEQLHAYMARSELNEVDLEFDEECDLAADILARDSSRSQVMRDSSCDGVKLYKLREGSRIPLPQDDSVDPRMKGA